MKRTLNENDPQPSTSNLSEEGNLPHVQQNYDFWSLHKTLASDQISKRKNILDELGIYLSSPVVSFDPKFDPIQTWKESRNVYPNLYKIAMKYLGLVATSVPSERLFSKAGATITQSRNRLLGKRLGKLIFLGSIPESEWF